VDEDEREDKREEEREEEQGRGTKEEEPSLRGPEKWDTNQVRRAIQRVSIRWLGVKLNIMAWRHSGKAIYRKYINDKVVIKAVVEGDEDEDGEDDAFDIQTGHSSKVGGTVYGRLITESLFSTKAQQAALRQVSIEWY
jgi:hypothetical protein